MSNHSKRCKREVGSLVKELGEKKIRRRGIYHVERFTGSSEKIGYRIKYCVVDERGDHYTPYVVARLLDGHYVLIREGSWGENLFGVEDKSNLKKADSRLKEKARELLRLTEGRRYLDLMFPPE